MKEIVNSRAFLSATCMKPDVRLMMFLGPFSHVIYLNLELYFLAVILYLCRNIPTACMYVTDSISERTKKKKGKTRSVTKAIRETVVFRILAA